VTNEKKVDSNTTEREQSRRLQHVSNITAMIDKKKKKKNKGFKKGQKKKKKLSGP
jgi:hypothetical protein